MKPTLCARYVSTHWAQGQTVCQANSYIPVGDTGRAPLT